MLNVVAGQHYNRVFGRKPASQQSRANPLYAGKDLRISELAPFALCIALRQEQTVWRDPGPMFERLTELVMLTAEFLRCPDMDDTSGTLLDNRIKLAEPNGTQRGRCLLADVSGYTRHCSPAICVTYA